MTTSVEPSASAGPGLLGPRITGRVLGRLAARAVTAGPREPVLAGGQGRPDIGPYFHEPTVLTDTSPDMALYGSRLRLREVSPAAGCCQSC